MKVTCIIVIFCMECKLRMACSNNVISPHQKGGGGMKEALALTALNICYVHGAMVLKRASRFA